MQISCRSHQQEDEDFMFETLDVVKADLDARLWVYPRWTYVWDGYRRDRLIAVRNQLTKHIENGEVLTTTTVSRLYLWAVSL